jgi:glutaconate CoA-transferase subunit A
VEEPWGAHPGYTPGFYDVDFTFGYQYQKASDTVEGFKAFLDEWVFGVRDRTEYIQHYIQKQGYSAFKALHAEFDYGYPVSYAY